MALNHAPWVAKLARLQVVFCTQLRPRAAAGSNCSTKEKCSSCHNMAVILTSRCKCKLKRSESSVLLKHDWPPSGWSISAESHLKFLHTSLWETPIRSQRIRSKRHNSPIVCAWSTCFAAVLYVFFTVSNTSSSTVSFF